MANNPSAEKRDRQAGERRQRNRSHRSRMRTAVKNLRQTIAAGDAEAARKQLPETLQLIDSSAQKGTIHGNAAARTKSRLTRAVAKL